MYDSRLKNPQTDLLVQALLSLKDEEECYRFMEDLLTMREIQRPFPAAGGGGASAGQGDL